MHSIPQTLHCCRSRRKGVLGIKFRKGLKVKKPVSALNLPLHSRHKKGRKPKRAWLVE
jgi:hypothetical protein